MVGAPCAARSIWTPQNPSTCQKWQPHRGHFVSQDLPFFGTDVTAEKASTSKSDHLREGKHRSTFPRKLGALLRDPQSPVITVTVLAGRSPRVLGPSEASSGPRALRGLLGPHRRAARPPTRGVAVDARRGVASRVAPPPLHTSVDGEGLLLQEAVEARGNKLRGSEYDATTWSARTWMGFTAQRVSCALARAVAWELASAMELTRVRDARDDD